MLLAGIIRTIIIGIVLSVGLWAGCSFLVMKLYPRNSLNIRYHAWGMGMAILTFIVYVALSLVSATMSGIKTSVEYVKEQVVSQTDVIEKFSTLLVDRQPADDPDFQLTQITNVLTSNYPVLAGLDWSSANLPEQLVTGRELSVTKQVNLLLDYVFTYSLDELTRPFRTTWWCLLITLLIIQCLYWGVMFVRMEKQGRKKTVKRRPRMLEDMY